jgi:hypothetical protein
MLLASPGIALHALRLVSSRQDGPDRRPAGERGADRERSDDQIGDTHQPALDEHANSDLKRNIEELAVEIAEAKSNNDTSRQIRCEQELQQLTDAFLSAHGLGGRDRNINTPVAEKARQSVSQALRRACGKMENETTGLPKLVAHLQHSIKVENGMYKYAPLPPAPRWTL